jgi:hypothetical protein
MLKADAVGVEGPIKMANFFPEYSESIGVHAGGDGRC